MYRPKMFDIDDTDDMHGIIRANGFAVLVTTGAQGMTASHVPLHLVEDGELGLLWGHLAKGNDQWQAFDSGAEALAVFGGPHTYISPTWYASEKSVPTWNYEAVHAYGRPRVMDDPEAVVARLASLTGQYEGTDDSAWSPRTLPADFVAAQLKGIVAFEMRIERLEGKRKMSQNRKPEDVAGAIDGLKATGRPVESQVAEIVAKANKDRL
ncbi:MAG: FMN-binding negative transcriptional regulator [Alphaproteobacteria bacterium]